VLLEFSVIIVFCEYLWCICLTFLSVFFYMCAEICSHSSACHSDCWCGCMSL